MDAGRMRDEIMFSTVTGTSLFQFNGARNVFIVPLKLQLHHCYKPKVEFVCLFKFKLLF